MIACQSSNIVIAVSDDNKKRLIELYSIPEEKVIVVPNGVDCNNIRLPAAEEKEKAKHMLGYETRKIVMFVGSLYRPNQEAAQFIIEKIAPKLTDHIFLIVGNLGVSLPPGVSDNVKITGFVDDERKRTIFKAADVAINPIFHGSGTNLKMLEYMAWGLPVVTTVTGARGLKVNEDNNTLIISSENDFADNIQHLLENNVLCDQLRKNGRKLVEQYYGWDRLTVMLIDSVRVYQLKTSQSLND
jgi:Glycosyltransferase